MEEQTKKTEALLLELTRQEEKKRKKLFVRSRVLYFVMVFYLMFSTALIIIWKKLTYTQSAAWILFLIALVPYFTGGALGTLMKMESLRFKCKQCEHEFSAPKFGKDWFSFRIRCPHCGKKTWVKTVFPKS